MHIRASQWHAQSATTSLQLLACMQLQRSAHTPVSFAPNLLVCAKFIYLRQIYLFAPNLLVCAKFTCMSMCLNIYIYMYIIYYIRI